MTPLAPFSVSLVGWQREPSGSGDDGGLDLVVPSTSWAVDFDSYVFVLGKDMETLHEWNAANPGPEGALAFADYNGDGKLDIINPSKLRWR